ncbi:protein translocase subunit SecD [Niveibacterium microcysteis]|uniref:Protein translocase subunit SecD n=1 Tax=Niveibacterium microcysteis TaxID=2811415 RepID=A0ABX7MB08_9RHOO|nr:protein translocase subunit SecD [Niveibacterium microcysteis]QSI77839.1 protein translocase subunit SecD [Niveibacterium microcysteis]
MNRYPLWKNLLILVVLLFGILYTLPNYFGEVPAVQVSSAKSTIRLSESALATAEKALSDARISHDGVFFDNNSVRVRLGSTDAQIKAKDALEHAFNPDPKDPGHTVALNLLSASPKWLTAIHALPMYLGLDLRGGVHFLLQVDMKGAITKRLDSTTGDMRTMLREKDIRHGGIVRDGESLVVRFRDVATRDKARNVIRDRLPDLQLVDKTEADEQLIVGTLTEQAKRRIQEDAIKQNIVTLHNRINELGVAEPVIQQQGADRIVVQLPGVQDVAKAKSLIGRTATLEVRMVDEAATQSGSSVGVDVIPERRRDGSVIPVAVKKQIVLTGDRFNGADATFDSNQQPAVAVSLDAAGGRIMRDVTRDSVGKRMAIILYERGKGEAISVATIQGEFGNRFQITGQFSPDETTSLAILIRSGSLAAPMDIIEERTIGPSLGADNIAKGFKSTMWGFIAIAIFMVIYYMVFGLVSVIALGANLLLLLALLSLLQATLTLPGIAAIAFTLGMAIDANVLINERIREELRNGSTPQAAIAAGYERAFGTILDSNVTTLIAGIALLIFGSGPVRGFAVVHCLGILTSMFSSVLVSRMVTNFIYGGRRKLQSIAIGQIWRPAADTQE